MSDLRCFCPPVWQHINLAQAGQQTCNHESFSIAAISLSTRTQSATIAFVRVTSKVSTSSVTPGPPYQTTSHDYFGIRHDPWHLGRGGYVSFLICWALLGTLGVTMSDRFPCGPSHPGCPWSEYSACIASCGCGGTRWDPASCCARRKGWMFWSRSTNMGARHHTGAENNLSHSFVVWSWNSLLQCCAPAHDLHKHAWGSTPTAAIGQKMVYCGIERVEHRVRA